MKIPALALLLCLSLVGCSIFPSGDVHRQYHKLILPEQVAKPAPRGGSLLAVRLFEVVPSFANQAFVYRMGDDEWTSDYYNWFTVSPAELMTTVFRKRLGESGIFRAIAIPGLDTGADYFLEGYVQELYADFRDRTSPQAVLALQIAVYEGSPNAQTLVLINRYKATVNLPSGEPTVLARAWGQATSEILDSLAQDLQKIRQRRALLARQ